MPEIWDTLVVINTISVFDTLIDLTFIQEKKGIFLFLYSFIRINIFFHLTNIKNYNNKFGKYKLSMDKPIKIMMVLGKSIF